MHLGRIRRRQALKIVHLPSARGNTKIALHGKSHQSLPRHLNLSIRVLDNRKNNTLIFSEIFITFKFREKLRGIYTMQPLECPNPSLSELDGFQRPPPSYRSSKHQAQSRLTRRTPGLTRASPPCARFLHLLLHFSRDCSNKERFNKPRIHEIGWHLFSLISSETVRLHTLAIRGLAPV
jgi:hypothetical protein